MNMPINSSVESVSVFFPCYNDEFSIGPMVETAREALIEAGVDYEITVVNDASPDNSAQVLENLVEKYPGEVKVITHQPNRGYGGALKSGFTSATKQWVFYTDGDGQYDPSELLLLIKNAGNDVDIVQGYKTIDGQVRGRNDSIVRKIIGRMYHHFVSIFFRLKIRDVDCDFRLIRNSVLKELDLRNDSGVICLELVRKLQDQGARFVEVPVSHLARPHGSSQFFNIPRVTKTLFALMVEWKNLVAQANIKNIYAKYKNR